MKCYIVGSGTSLDVKFLDTLQNEFTFSTNSIGSIYDKTVWRPTIYTLTSDNFANPKRRSDYIQSMKEAEMVFAKGEYVISFNLKAFPFKVREEKEFSRVPYIWVSKFGTSLLPCVQLAFWLGVTEIVFVGCNGYTSSGRQHVEGYPDWAEDFDTTFYAKTLYEAHELVAQVARADGVHVSFEGESQFASLYAG